MSEPHDQRLLPVEGSVPLWCRRIWIVGQRRPIGAERGIQDMLARLDAPDAEPYLESLMLALSHGAARKAAVTSTCRSSISEDERALLTPEGARAALRSAEGIGFARAGRSLLAPETQMRRFALAAGSAETFRHVGTVH